MGGGKSGSAGKSYNYHATLAGAICWGPIDAVHAVIIDGKAVWEGTMTRGVHGTADFVDVGAAMDAKWFLKGGYLRIYWGTTTQAVNPTLSVHGHPPYLGVAYVVARRFLLGRERSTAPNIEVVVSRAPAPPVEILDATALDDGQANPVAALAEILTDRRGLAIPPTRFDADSWQDAADWCGSSLSRRAITYCSPLLGDSRSARAAVAGLLAMFEGTLRWTPQGTLSVIPLETGTPPAGETVLDAAQFTDPPRMTAGSWGSIPAAVDVRFHDRDRMDKETSEPVTNLVAARIFGATLRGRLDAEHVTRRDQARLVGAEFLRRNNSPPVTIEVRCRRQSVLGIAPGDKVRLDIDPEPGGDGLAQVVVVQEVRDDGKAVRLRCVADPLLDATPYTLHLVPDAPQAATMAPIAHATIIPLDPAAWGSTGLLGVLATRPQADALGMRVFLSADGTNFAEVGRQIGFAVRASIPGSVTDAAETIRLTLVDGEDGLDAYLIEQASPGGNTAAARADQLLVVLASLDGNGRVAIDDGGVPVLEIVSVIARTVVSAGVHDYSVLRARMGTQPFSWAPGAVAWIVPGINLTPWTHPDLQPAFLSGAPVFARLTAFSAWAEDETPTPPERSLIFPGSFDRIPRIAWTTPATTIAETAANGDALLAFTVTDRNGDMVGIRIATRDSAGGVTEWLDMPLQGSSSEVVSFTLRGLPTGTHTVTVEAVDRAGHVSTDSSRTLHNPNSGVGGGGAGTTLQPPAFSPPSGATFQSALTVTITGQAPADRLAFAITGTAVSDPAVIATIYETSPGTLTRELELLATKKVWARAGDGSTWSDWRVATYEKTPGGIPN